MIELKHLTKKYGDNLAVNDLNLTLEPGHVYGFLGPNGAGKSTTLNMITGYIGATSGEVIIEGHDINKEPEAAKKCMGYLPEMPPVYGDMKVGEYLNFAAELKGLKKVTRVADIRQVMDLTKLYDMENRLIKNLSKGYRQRVGLAQALMGMPPIIILDEPTVGLDPKQIIEIRELITSLKEDHTVILSSHILQEISAVCDYVFIISHGKLVADDTMENLESQMSGGQQLELELMATVKQAQGLKKVAGVKSCDVEDITKAAQPVIPEATVDTSEYKEETDEEIPAAAVEISENKENEAEAPAAAESAVPVEASAAAESVVSAEAPASAKELKVSVEDPTPEAKVILTARAGEDIREDVFRYCAANNMVILEMSTVTKSLEDVFLALTEDKEVA